MKKENGASFNFFNDVKDRMSQSIENTQNQALTDVFGQDAANLMIEKRGVNNQFNKFNTAAKENTNPFGNLAAVEADNKQKEMNKLTGQINQSVAINNAQNTATDLTNNVMDQANRANPFKPNDDNDPYSTQGAPMSNGTGSGRPNFDEGATMSIKKVNEGAPMSNVLFKNK